MTEEELRPRLLGRGITGEVDPGRASDRAPPVTSFRHVDVKAGDPYGSNRLVCLIG